VKRRFGPYGGQYVPETLMPALAELEQAWSEAGSDAAFRAELDALLRDFAGRPTPLYLAAGLSRATGRRIYLKREDLLHTGSHKLNNALGQALLARRMGKPRVIAETGAGQHGVASATAAALLGLECVVYMGTEDIRRQAPNVQRMRLLGATVEPVSSGARTLKEAVSEAIRDWVANAGSTHYIIGSVVGPAPYPALVRDLQRVIGQEARAESLYQQALAIKEKVLGPDHPDTASTFNNLANLYKDQGKDEQAELLYLRVLDIYEKVLRPEHPDIAGTLYNLANLYRDQNKYDEAEALFQRDLAIKEKALGPEHPDTALSLDNLASLYSEQGRNERAETLYMRALAIREKMLGPEHPDTAGTLNNLGLVARYQGDYAAARMGEEAVILCRDRVRYLGLVPATS